MFGPEARARVQEILRQVEQQHRVPVLIETIESLEGQDVAAEARRRAQGSGRTGVYILLARKDSKLQILISRAFRGLIPQPELGGIVVTWRQHDRMSLERVRGAAVEAAVERTMNAAIADVLTELGFPVTPVGTSGCHLVAADQQSASAA